VQYSFPYHNGRQQTDSVRYLALVLRPGDVAPQVVPLLTDEAPLRRLLARKTGASAEATLYVTRGSELDTDQLTQGDSLYQLIWKPLDKLLNDAKTVYLSPSGLLHQVAFSALPYPTNTTEKAPRYLADRYQLRQVGSTRQVATQTKGRDTYQSLNSATLYGGIQYDSVATTVTRTGAWPFLPGSEREVSQITQFVGPKRLSRLNRGSLRRCCIWLRTGLLFPIRWLLKTIAARGGSRAETRSGRLPTPCSERVY
jgi:hypothetical protein